MNPTSASPTIAYQGEPGANSHIACERARPDHVPMAGATFEDVFAAVSDSTADLAMIPIENLTAGCVADIHYLLPASELHIVGEHFLLIHFGLLGVPGARIEDLRSVRSHIQALGQCRRMIRRLGLKPIVSSDTAGSAREVAEAGDPTQASLAPVLAAKIHGLDVLESDVEGAHNATRFVVLAREELRPPPGSHVVTTSSSEDWSEDLFFDVIEALHDLVARPRYRCWHDYGKHWDYQDFARTPGQAVYQWKVNKLLARSEVPLRLADSGSDRGRLVHAPGDARDELVLRALQSPEAKVRNLVDHAVAQFRGRGATFLAKREATKTLADVLEHRRRLLKAVLFQGDEGALFQIANHFEIRHINERQKGDYDPAFLDWIFWWYLATIELTDRLLDRQTGS